MRTDKTDWTPFLMLAIILAFIAAQHWLLCIAVVLVWERLLQHWRLQPRGLRGTAKQARAWSRD